MMRLTVNGERHEHGGDGTVTALLQEIGATPERVALLVNGEVVRGAKRDAVVLREGDSVEVVGFAGGG